MTSFTANSPKAIELASESQRISLASGLMLKLKQGQTFIGSFLHRHPDIFKFLVTDSPDFGSLVHKPNFKLMRVEPEIGEAELKHLADVCHRSDKAVFLNLPQAHELPQEHNAIAWSVKRALDWLAAF